MTETEIELLLEKYLRENLSIDVDSYNDYYSKVGFTVSILLEGKVIASGTYSQ